MQQQIKRKTQKESLVKDDWSISGETTTRALRKSNPTPTNPIQYLGGAVGWAGWGRGTLPRKGSQDLQHNQARFSSSRLTPRKATESLTKATITQQSTLILGFYKVLPLEPYFVFQSLSWESLFLSICRTQRLKKCIRDQQVGGRWMPTWLLTLQKWKLQKGELQGCRCSRGDRGRRG